VQGGCSSGRQKAQHLAWMVQVQLATNNKTATSSRGIRTMRPLHVQSGCSIVEQPRCTAGLCACKPGGPTIACTE
jgi:hypothetical protein